MTISILPQAPNSDLAVAIDRARGYAEAAHSTATRRAYATGWADFQAWALAHGLQALPATPQALALYVTALAERGMRLASIRLYVAAVAHTHRERGLESPTGHDMVRRVLRGISRALGASQVKKSALTVDALRAVLLAITGNDLKSKRDKAMILLGFGAALRRSEIAALCVEDIRFPKQGAIVNVRRSKTDQEAQGVEIAVPYVKNASLCAVKALRIWLDASDLKQEPLFRSFTLRREMLETGISGRDVANLVKVLTRKARLDGDFSGHSLRAGFATSAAAAKASLDSIARTTRHKSLGVLMGYVRPAQVFDDTALSAVIA